MSEDTDFQNGLEGLITLTPGGIMCHLLSVNLCGERIINVKRLISSPPEAFLLLVGVDQPGEP